MPKHNPMLARIEAAAEARYQVRFHKSMDMLLQIGQDAAMIAATMSSSLALDALRTSV